MKKAQELDAVDELTAGLAGVGLKVGDFLRTSRRMGRRVVCLG